MWALVNVSSVVNVLEQMMNSVSPGSILFEGGSWWRRQQENPAAIAEFVKHELPFVAYGAKFRVLGPGGEREVAQPPSPPDRRRQEPDRRHRGQHEVRR